MKFKTNKLSLKVIIASAMLATSLPALAVTGDTDQPIHIESDTQSLDMQGNVVTFTGNVVMTQGTIKINADKVVVTRPGGEQGKEIIDGYGNPATFYQMQDNGKPVKGKGTIVYNSSEFLRRRNSKIKHPGLAVGLRPEHPLSLLGDKAEASLDIDGAGGLKHVVGPERKLAVTLLPAEADAFIDQQLAEPEAAG